MSQIKCFMIQRAATSDLRACYSHRGECPSHEGQQHIASLEFLANIREDEDWSGILSNLVNETPAPICDCGFQFAQSDYYGGGTSHHYINLDTGEKILKREPGAMWWGPAYSWNENEEALALYVQTPGGEWCIDSRASNCTMPDDNIHRCWIRNGEPPNITVDKNGHTCSAGAGSIQCGRYHGFLRNGYLTE